jgi:hypothetical protein
MLVDEAVVNCPYFVVAGIIWSDAAPENCSRKPSTASRETAGFMVPSSSANRIASGYSVTILSGEGRSE